MEITLGTGHYKIGVIDKGNKTGVAIEYVETPHQVGECAGDPEGTPYQPDERDVVIWINSAQAAAVLIEQIAKLAASQAINIEQAAIEMNRLYEDPDGGL